MNWAINRIRPASLDASIEKAPVLDDISPAVVQLIATENTAELAASGSGAVNAVSTHEDATVTVDAPSVAEEDAPVFDLAESPPAEGGSDDADRETPPDIEVVGKVDEGHVATAEIGTATDAPKPGIGTELPGALSTEVETSSAAPVAIVVDEVDPSKAPTDDQPIEAENEPIVTAEQASPTVDPDPAPVEAPVLVAINDGLTDATGAVEQPDEPSITPVDLDVVVELEADVEFDASPADAAAAAPAAPVAAEGAEHAPAGAPSDVIEIAIAPVVALPSPDVRSPPKMRARPVEPADRAALIRKRWTESGIRMWNPRLHGTGEATLNIQGSVGLLPPATGDTMPRYDKLEFRMLGGQIVCEGVIVEAPAHASQRSFTQLAETKPAERVRERQTALA